MPARTRKSNSKSHAVKGMIRGKPCASKLEEDFAKHLDLLKSADEVREWFYEPERWRLVVNGKDIGYYTPDFYVVPSEGEPYYVDTKGFVPKGWPFRLKVIRACYPDKDLRIITRKDF